MTDERDLKQYITVAEIATMVGLSEKSVRVYQERAARRRREGGERHPTEMPAPKHRFGRTPVWDRDDIERWRDRRAEVHKQNRARLTGRVSGGL